MIDEELCKMSDEQAESKLKELLSQARAILKDAEKLADFHCMNFKLGEPYDIVFIGRDWQGRYGWQLDNNGWSSSSGCAERIRPDFIEVDD